MEQTEAERKLERFRQEWQEEITGEIDKRKENKPKTDKPKAKNPKAKTPKAKKPKAKKPKANIPKQKQAPKPTSFLTLPNEIRQQILEYMCRDAVAIPSKPFRLPSASVTASMLESDATLVQWEIAIARAKEIGSTHPYTELRERIVHIHRLDSFVDGVIVAIPETHNWARSMELIHDELIGDVVAVERALVRMLRNERVDLGTELNRLWR